MKKTKLKIIVKMRKIDNFKYNYDVDYNDDECEDIGKVREMDKKIRKTRINEVLDETEDHSVDEENRLF